MKLAVVVSRYGPAVHGGTEHHARYIAEHLATHADVEVLTTCASDDRTWANQWRPGTETVNGVRVRRFRVSGRRRAAACEGRARRVLYRTHSVHDELTWLEAEGPTSHSLLRHLRAAGNAYDFCLFFGYRSYQSVRGARAVAPRAVLVPHAGRDEAIGARVFRDLFCGVRAILYDSPEERSLIQAAAGGARLDGVVAGAGVDAPPNPQPARFRQTHDIRGPFAICVGTVDAHGGRADLLALYERYANDAASRLSLVLAGEARIAIPAHPKIAHVGVLDEADKFDAIAAADVLLAPSGCSSFSRTAVEAWSLGKPVLANAASDATRGQCVRSGGGLCYANGDEFVAMLQAIEKNRWLNASLGRSGRQYVRDAYDWRIVERKYHDLLLQLQKDGPRPPAAPWPGWMARRRRDVPPAAEVARGLR